MPKQFTDSEFGEIRVNFRAGTRSIKVSMGTDGRLQASAPKFTPLIAVKAMINTERSKIRQLFGHHLEPGLYEHGQQIGKSHHLAVIPAPSLKEPHIRTQDQNILLRLPPSTPLESAGVQRLIRDNVISALRKEAKAHLPRRLQLMAEAHGYHYQRVRFSHAGTRWGSCSSTGTISLNIALMKLPDELIDYVLAHELCHTVQMNHSPAFWAQVAAIDPAYRLHRKQLKLQTPTI